MTHGSRQFVLFYHTVCGSLFVIEASVFDETMAEEQINCVRCSQPINTENSDLILRNTYDAVSSFVWDSGLNTSVISIITIPDPIEPDQQYDIALDNAITTSIEEYNPLKVPATQQEISNLQTIDTIPITITTTTTTTSAAAAKNTFYEGKDEICSICQDELYQAHTRQNEEKAPSDGNSPQVLNVIPVAKIRNCHHTFHKSCLLSWLRENAKCPICRGAI